MCKLNYLVINDSTGDYEVTDSPATALYMRMDAVAKGERISIIHIPNPIPPLEAPEHYPDELKGD